MNKYKAYFNNREDTVESDTLWGAVQKARQLFKPAKSKEHMVHCVLIEKDGDPVSLFNSNAELG